MDRRSFLIAVGSSASTLAVPGGVRAGDGGYHVVYPSPGSAADAVQLRDQIAVLLGEGVAAYLRVARQGDDYVVVYDRSHIEGSSDQARAEQVAANHDRLLRASLDSDDTMAFAVAVSSLSPTYNIRYGEPATTPDALQARWREVARMLGAGVAKSLVIEALPTGGHHLIYQRQGDRVGTQKVAAHHHQLLRAKGIAVSAVPEAFGTIDRDGSTEGAVASPAPQQVTATETVHLPASVDGDLRDAINEHVQMLRSRGRVSNEERTAWVVHDLRADRTLCAINAAAPMQAASMIKPFVALAFFHRAQAGELSYGPISTQHMEQMIRDSSNTSTNWLLERAGGPAAAQRILRRHYGEIAKEVALVEYIPGGGRTYRNLASANDHARLLRALWRAEVPYATELRRVMNLPSADRLYRNVPEIPVGTEVYNKTGTTARCCGDMGILVARSREESTRIPYILVGVIERSSRVRGYTSWMHSRGDVIREVSGLTYRYLKGVYDLV